MSARSDVNNELARLALSVADKVSTPFYMFDFGTLRGRYAEFKLSWRTYFPEVECAYSYKTNPLSVVASALRLEGAGAEVVSAKELEWALADGFSGNQIRFNGPVKSEAGLRRSISLGVTVHIDSLDELDLVLRIANDHPPKVVLRTAHPLSVGGWSRFGLLPEECWIAIDRLQKSGVPTLGVHFHVGSTLNTSDHVNAICQNASLLRHLLSEASTGRKVHVDIGGGFPAQSASESGVVTSASEFAAAVLEALRTVQIDANRLLVVSEPGRCLVEDACVLVTRVVSRKTREGRPMLIVDAGLDLVRSPGAWHHSVSFIEHPLISDASSYSVYGARCYENDLLPSVGRGPRDVPIGALIAIGSAGAYGLTQACIWNGLCAPIFGIDGSNLFGIERGGRLPEYAMPNRSSSS
jgi:diaminopimelate decarboxylase